MVGRKGETQIMQETARSASEEQGVVKWEEKHKYKKKMLYREYWKDRRMCLEDGTNQRG